MAEERRWRGVGLGTMRLGEVRPYMIESLVFLVE